MGSKKSPFESLGQKLKALRESKQETVGEVSGAVEIDIAELSKIEQGQTRPSEDILNLLISHFEMQDADADQLWELAGYEKSEIAHSHNEDQTFSNQQSVMVLPTDARIVYTDMVHVMVNNYGVVMNFMQGSGPSMQPLAVARIGMSKEHAQSVLDVLQKTLRQAEAQQVNKSLPNPKDSKKRSKNDS